MIDLIKNISRKSRETIHLKLLFRWSKTDVVKWNLSADPMICSIIDYIFVDVDGFVATL
jgi:hypothetical protein